MILGVSSATYDKVADKGDGVLFIDDTDPTKESYMLDIRTDLDLIKEKDEIVLKIKPSQGKHTL